MSGLESSIIGAVGGLGEAVISGLGQSSANRANARMADKQMAFQERMSSTAMQRFKSDAMAAGLNPLYWLKGGASSTPSGSSSDMRNVTEGIRGTTAKALEARINAAAVRNLEAQNSQILSQTGLNIASAKEVAERAKQVSASTRALESSLPGLKNKESIEKSWFGKSLGYVDRFTHSAKGVTDIVNPFATRKHEHVNVNKRGR